MGQKANTLLSNITTNSSPNNLNWENAKHACLDRKNLIHPPIPAEILHDLQKWSEDEVNIKHKIPEPINVNNPGTADNRPQTTTGVKNRKTLALEKEKLNLRHKGIHQKIDMKIIKEIEQVARKTIRLATKMKDLKIFEQKYKTTHGRILTYTPHTAWVQMKGKQPRLLGNSGSAFVPNPLIYGPSRTSTLSDYVAYKSARRIRPCLRCLDIENPSATRHTMFKEDASGLPVNLTRKEEQTSPPKRKPTGKRTGGRPAPRTPTRGMKLQSETRREESATSLSSNDLGSSTLENIAPSPKRINKKKTPDNMKQKQQPTRKSGWARQSIFDRVVHRQNNKLPEKSNRNTRSKDEPKKPNLGNGLS